VAIKIPAAAKAIVFESAFDTINAALSITVSELEAVSAAVPRITFESELRKMMIIAKITAHKKIARVIDLE
jgi:hypothetical protein